MEPTSWNFERNCKARNCGKWWLPRKMRMCERVNIRRLFAKWHSETRKKHMQTWG